MTGQYLPMVSERAAPRRRASHRLGKWLGPVAGALAALVVVGVLGIAKHFWLDRPTAMKERAVASLPIAMPAPAPQTGDAIVVVDSPYAVAAPVDGPTKVQGPIAAASSAPVAAPMPLPAASVAKPSPAAPAPAARPAASQAQQLPAGRVQPAPAAMPAQAKASSAAEKARDEPPVVFNEPAPVRAAAAADAAAKPSTVIASSPAVARASSPSAPAGKIRLVAIKDASTILLGIPGQLVPVQFKPGARLPNGATIVNADPARGQVRLDNGTTLSLE